MAVYFIEVHIDVRRKNPIFFKHLQINQPIYTYNKDIDKDLKQLEKKCQLIQNFLNITNKQKGKSTRTHLEEVLKILNLIIFSLWAKESIQHFFYDSKVSPYKKLILYCIYNDGN